MVQLLLIGGSTQGLLLEGGGLQDGFGKEKIPSTSG